MLGREKRPPSVRELALLAGVLVVTTGCAPTPPDEGERQGDSTDHQGTQWTYEGESGPDRWVHLDPGFALCGTGSNQSPIDLFAGAEGQVVRGGLASRYGTSDVIIRSQTVVEDILDNGHTIQVDQPGASRITLNGLEMELVQFHFHAPSEHLLEGESFPLEIHFVYSSDGGALAVVGVFVEEGAAHTEIAKIVDNLPEHGEARHPMDVHVAVDALLPETLLRYRYSGSLTTPPCSEGVRWAVMATPIQASFDQIEAIRSRMPVNNRPLQELNGRLVTLLTP